MESEYPEGGMGQPLFYENVEWDSHFFMREMGLSLFFVTFSCHKTSKVTVNLSSHLTYAGGY
jgi:hypothetical protein